MSDRKLTFEEVAALVALDESRRSAVEILLAESGAPSLFGACISQMAAEVDAMSQIVYGQEHKIVALRLQLEDLQKLVKKLSLFRKGWHIFGQPNSHKVFCKVL